MDAKQLHKISEAYNNARQRFFAALKMDTPPTKKDIPPLKKTVFETMKKFEDIECDEQPVASWDFKKNQLFKDGGLPRVIFLKRQKLASQRKTKTPDGRSKENIPYFYHLCYCEKLKLSSPQALQEKWVKSFRNDGYFVIDLEIDGKVHASHKTNDIKQIKVCGTCFKVLGLKEKGYNRNKFDIKRFFRESYMMPRIDFPEMNTPLTNRKNEYLDSWTPDRKARLKEARGYVCNRCKKQFDKDTQHMLTIHHINKERSNNRLSNLEVLCEKCHYIEHHPDEFGQS